LGEKKRQKESGPRKLLPCEPKLGGNLNLKERNVQQRKGGP